MSANITNINVNTTISRDLRFKANSANISDANNANIVGVLVNVLVNTCSTAK